MAEFDLKDLAEITGVSTRTVYFYVQQGLLPPAEGSGRAARYTEVHRDRLLLIRQLQGQYLPLAEIRKQIEALSDRELSRLVGASESQPPRASSAADYIRDVLAGAGAHGAETPGTPAARPLDADGAHTPTQSNRSQWERIALTPEIELHVRRPLSRLMNRRLEELLEKARAVLKEQK